MRIARLDITAPSDALSEAQRARMREVLSAALEETGRFRIQPGTPDCVFAAKVLLEKGSAGGRRWEVTLELHEAPGGRLIQRYSAGASGPADGWLDGAFLKELAYRYAPPDSYPDLARKAGLSGRLEHPGLQSRDPEILMAALMEEMESGEWEKALGHADTVLDLQPAHSTANNARALALQRLGRLPDALDAIERHPEARTSPISLNLKADILCDMERYAAGKECYEEALELDPESKDSALKLRALAFFLESPPDRDLLFPRIGWCVNFLALAPLVDGPSERNKPNIEAAFEDLDAAFDELVGERLSFYLERRLLSAWRGAVRDGDQKAFSAACTPVVKGILRGAGHHFPGRAFRWLRWGYDLNWMQFGLGKHLQDMRDGEAPQESDVSRDFSELAAQMGSDSYFLERCPSMSAVAARLSKAAEGIPSIEKLESACRGIDSFCEVLFSG